MKEFMENVKKSIQEDLLVRKGKVVLFFVLILLYLAAAAATSYVASSDQLITIGNRQLPLISFTGVFSSISNLCVIFLVVYCGKTGFGLCMFVYVIRLLRISHGLFFSDNLPSIPGLFTSLVTMTAIILLYRRNVQLERYQQNEISILKDQQKLSQRLFEQTATALVNAIDAKDEYSHGHSLRVAEYSKRLAELMGKDETECYRIYHTALLHDVGKIGIDDRIITKNGKLTDEEYAVIKTHPTIGDQILSSISEYPYLSIGAHFHHERYDGKGYPLGLKGNDIPEIARIIAVADAYDAMTSNRSYRDAVPQQIVREEIVKNSGTQFDPEIAKVMQHLIDLDTEYKMKEWAAVKELAGKNELDCREYRDQISDGIVLTSYRTSIHLRCQQIGDGGQPTIILFDSLDARVHDEEKTIRDLNYFEYCEIWFDGNTVNGGARKIEVNVMEREDNDEHRRDPVGRVYDVEAVKCTDHVLIQIDDGLKKIEVTVALPDSSRFAYIALTGTHCHISDVRIVKADKPVPADYIPRIAEEISYINVPEGDIPNVQVDGYRTKASEAIPVKDEFKIEFDSMSLPTARLVWHCPFMVIYGSTDGKVDGEDYREYGLIRLDGESWQSRDISDNKVMVNRTDDFEDWNAWKAAQKEGVHCVVEIKRDGNIIVTNAENKGIAIRNVTTILDGTEDIYIALTGDQVALTGIKIG